MILIPDFTQHQDVILCGVSTKTFSVMLTLRNYATGEPQSNNEMNWGRGEPHKNKEVVALKTI